MGLGTGMDMQVGTKNPKVFVNFPTFELTKKNSRTWITIQSMVGLTSRSLPRWFAPMVLSSQATGKHHLFLLFLAKKWISHLILFLARVNVELG